MIASIKDGIVNVCGEEYYRGSESEGWKKYRNEKKESMERTIIEKEG